MITLRTDLYEYDGSPAPNGAEAYLEQIIPEAPKGYERPRPAVLILPGGGYQYTSDREAEPVALRFAAAGFAAFVLRYSCAPARFPVSLREAAMAMRYIKERSEEYSIGSGKVAVMGFSAGAHLAGLLGTMWDGEEVADIAKPCILRPDALGLCYPVTVSAGRTHSGSFDNLCGEDKALRDRLSLEKLVRSDMPPVFLWHTRNDGAVPCYGTLLLAQAIEEAGVDFALHVYRNGGHGLSTADIITNTSGAIQNMSRDVPGWFEAELGFFEELGIGVGEGTQE